MYLPFSSFTLQDDVLCRTLTIFKDEVTQLVIPAALVDTVLQLLHDTPQAGHRGHNRTLAVAHAIDIETHISQWISCPQTNVTTKLAPIFSYPLPTGPFDVVGIDLFQLPHSKHGSVCILFGVDHFTRFLVLAPLSNNSSKTVAYAMVSHLICIDTNPRVFSATMARS